MVFLCSFLNKTAIVLIIVNSEIHYAMPVLRNYLKHLRTKGQAVLIGVHLQDSQLNIIFMKYVLYCDLVYFSGQSSLNQLRIA